MLCELLYSVAGLRPLQKHALHAVILGLMHGRWCRLSGVSQLAAHTPTWPPE